MPPREGCLSSLAQRWRSKLPVTAWQLMSSELMSLRRRQGLTGLGRKGSASSVAQLAVFDGPPDRCEASESGMTQDGFARLRAGPTNDTEKRKALVKVPEAH